MKTKAFLLSLLALCLMLCACSKKEEAPVDESPEVTESLPVLPTAAPPSEYGEIKLYYEGLLTGRAYTDGESIYISPDSVAAIFDMALETEADAGSFSVSGEGLLLSGSRGTDYMLANDRYLFIPEGFLLQNGRVYLPADAIGRIFGLELNLIPEMAQAHLRGDKLRLIQGGEHYYELNYDQNDIYWLQQIIYSESRDEPLAGMIGVGNVVLNRVRSELYPNTIFDVVFDREYGVQFDPVATGGIHEPADERSKIAACLCLEGYWTVGDSLFFVNPDRGDATWVSKSRSFVCAIGNHDFYA